MGDPSLFAVVGDRACDDAAALEEQIRGGDTDVPRQESIPEAVASVPCVMLDTDACSVVAWVDCRYKPFSGWKEA